MKHKYLLSPIKYSYYDEKTWWNKCKGYVIAFLLTTLILGTILFSCRRGDEVYAESIYPTNLWKGLIAEATSDGYEGMYAVACCVRNRLEKGMNTGLCGLNRKNLNQFIKREGVSREQEAKEIVEKVFKQNSKDVTKGAINFECIERYGTPSWVKGMFKTVKIGEHTFYKRGEK